MKRFSVRDPQTLVRELAQLPDRFAVCYEASCAYGYYHRQLRPLAERVVVAHPGQLRLIYRSKRKHDRLDAEKLAKLLLLDAVPAVHVPAANIQLWRQLITQRQTTIHKRTRAKNATRALLRTVGTTAPRQPGLWTNAGLVWLKSLLFE